jgi:hypothetical protein
MFPSEPNVQPFIAPPGWTPLATAELAPTSAEIAALGEPHFFDRAGNGCGPESVWAFRFACGLEAVIIGCFADLLDQGFWKALINEPTFEHFRAHTAFKVTWQGIAPFSEQWVPPASAFSVLRLDDIGNQFVVAAFPTREQATCFARQMEMRGHKQTFVVEQHGDPFSMPGLPAPAQRWAVIRQDDNGNRFRLAETYGKNDAERLASTYGKETRHKQTYWVEPSK